MEALEAHVLPSSRLANEAAGTTIRFIQASASPPLPQRALNFAASVSVHGSPSCLGPYTFRSMPRRSNSKATAAQPKSQSRRRPSSGVPAWTERLSKRVVQKPDGRYLIYFEKV